MPKSVLQVARTSPATPCRWTAFSGYDKEAYKGRNVIERGCCTGEQPPMAQMLARMERDGLIQRAPDPADGRRSRITLTAAAEARLPDAVSVLLQGNREALRDFTDEEAGLLVTLLTRLIANLDRIASVEAPLGRPIPEKGDGSDRPLEAD